MNEKVYIGLGANVGEREARLLGALAALSRIDAVSVLSCSSLYESAPVGPPQPRFLNAVVELEADLEPVQLLTILKQIERDLGRTPAEHWGPRTIDLDILLWGDRVVAKPLLQIPHLELHNRRFALEPLCEIAPDARHPILDAPVRKLLGQLLHQDVTKLESASWPET
ncbi:MAG: 2-amino-4-hydroxy-6-hydroxymethyldihydropteridine diphosphokinase [Myxococcaceae bacterium]